MWSGELTGHARPHTFRIFRLMALLSRSGHSNSSNDEVKVACRNQYPNAILSVNIPLTAP